MRSYGQLSTICLPQLRAPSPAESRKGILLKESSAARLTRKATEMKFDSYHEATQLSPDYHARELRNDMGDKQTGRRNEYRCCIEINQNGKYSVRIQARFGKGWSLPVFFLVSSFDTAMKRLEEALQLLQRDEERLWFWGVERSDDPKLAAELLKPMGLHYDQRRDFPRRLAEFVVSPGRSVPAFRLAQARRALAESITVGRAALASD